MTFNCCFRVILQCNNMVSSAAEQVGDAAEREPGQ